MGRWVKKVRRPHKCKTFFTEKYMPGSEWRCRCGQVWVIERPNSRDRVAGTRTTHWVKKEYV